MHPTPWRGMWTALFLLGVVAGWPGRAEVRVGSDRQAVEREWGAPQGSFSKGGQEILLYSDGRRVTLESGKVVNLTPAPVKAPDAAPPTPNPLPAADGDGVTAVYGNGAFVVAGRNGIWSCRQD